MHAAAIHLSAGSDLRRSLEELSRQHNANGFVLSVVGNLSEACFACPGRTTPTRLTGELEIITLQGSLSPEGVHLHLSVSDSDCQVWGGHLEHGSLVLKGADLLVGWLTGETQQRAPMKANPGQGRVTIAVAEGCPWSARALRMLRTLQIPFEQIPATTGGSLPQVFINGEPIGGYSELAELHGSGQLEWLRHG
jgi:predicted DNA-binding protein with PD1-like motif/glutaredoxin